MASSSRSQRFESVRHPAGRSQSKRYTTVMVLAGLFCIGVIIWAWFAGDPIVTQFFVAVDGLQSSSLPGLTVPDTSWFNLLLPTILVWLLVCGVQRLSPQPQRWSRMLTVIIMLVLYGRYMLWRATSTLNVADPVNGLFSLGLFAVEVVFIATMVVQLVQFLQVRDRRQQANQMELAVVQGKFRPTVDIFIPTYDEPLFLLRRTLIGCQALDYGEKRIHLLDDTQRPQVQQLAQELGCEYITRPDHRHAKAGNLNHAIAQTQGDLIVVFDADFVPTRNFLTRTVGFFQKEKVAMVQTPQSYYNPDPVAYNLGLGEHIAKDGEEFHQYVQPLRDAADAIVCTGTTFVLRRAALDSIGGCFTTESISEDIYTGVRLTAQGYELVYLNENLSAGLSAENIAAYVIQQVRWAQGSFQAFFIQSNPMRLPGLSPLQRISYFQGIFFYVNNSFPRIYLLWMPLITTFFGIVPIHATSTELAYFFLPQYLITLMTRTWQNGGTRSAFFSDMYTLVLCFPMAFTVVQALLFPFSRGFEVTPKGLSTRRFSMNWGLAMPLIGMFAITMVGFLINLYACITQGSWVIGAGDGIPLRGSTLILFWNTYNLVLLGTAVLALIDAPQSAIQEQFSVRRLIQLRWGDRTLEGRLTTLSEVEAEITLECEELAGEVPSTQAYAEDAAVQLSIPDENLILSGQVVHISQEHGTDKARIQFTDLTLVQQRQLVELLFCQPGQWQNQTDPGELQSWLLMVKTLLRPPFLRPEKPELPQSTHLLQRSKNLRKQPQRALSQVR